MKMKLAGIALRTFQAALVAFPFIIGFCFGYVGAFVALLVLAALAGIVTELHSDEGLFSPYRLHTRHPRAYSLLQDTKFFDFFGALSGAPVAFSVLIGAGVLAIRCLGWLATATWPLLTLQTFLGRPTTPDEIATGLRGLDQIVWVLVADFP